MRERSWMLSLVLLGALAGTAHGQSRLAWRFEEGEKFYVETVVITHDALKAPPGLDTKQDTERTSLTSFVVRKKNADGGVVLEQKIESMKVRVQGTLPKPDAALYQLMEGATFRLTFNAKMELKQFEGYEAAVARVAQRDAEAGKLFRTVLSEDMMRRSVDEAFGFLPNAELKPGEKWNRKLVLTLGPLGSLSGLNNYTYRGYVDGKEQIDVETNLSYVAPPLATDFVFQESDLKAENVRGTVLFDPQTGKLAQSEVRMRIKGSITVKVVTAAGSQLRAIEYDQEQTVRTRFLDKPPTK